MIIQCYNLEKKAPQQQHHLLKAQSFHIQKGEMLAIQGRSGAGKTTLLNILALLDQPSAGQYYLENKNVSTLDATEIQYQRQHTFGYIFQQYWLIEHLNVLDNICLPLQYLANPNQHDHQHLTEILNVLGLNDYLKRYPQQLSGGQQQRVSIARALVCNPKIILADEPTGALDQENSEKILALLAKINTQLGTTIIMVTHDAEVASKCQRQYRIETA